jgi:UDP-N-acetyl-D-mannosaminuronic acid transferase (WecB/TagA/CpsF family)
MIDLPSRISTIAKPDLLARIQTWTERNEAGHFVVPLEGDLLSRVRRDVQLQSALARADYVVPDGVTAAWLAGLYHRRRAPRIPGPDVFLAACEYGIRGDGGVTSSAARKACRNNWPARGRHATPTCAWWGHVRRPFAC